MSFSSPDYVEEEELGMESQVEELNNSIRESIICHLMACSAGVGSLALLAVLGGGVVWRC